MGCFRKIFYGSPGAMMAYVGASMAFPPLAILGAAVMGKGVYDAHREDEKEIDRETMHPHDFIKKYPLDLDGNDIDRFDM